MKIMGRFVATCAVAILVVSGWALANPEALRRYLAEYDKARAVYKKKLSKVGIKPEDVKFDKKPKLKKMQELGDVIMEYLPALQRARFWLGGARRVDAERALQTYDMQAMEKEISMLREKMIMMWSPKCTFFRMPFNMAWQPLENGSPAVMEYLILQDISADYPDVRKATKQGFVRWLHTRHESMGLDYFGSRGSKLTEYRPGQKTFKVFTMAGNALGFWFYIRSKSARKAKISVSVTSKGDSLAEIIVNGRSRGKKKVTSAKLKNGTNLIVILAKNLKEQEFIMQVHVQGGGLTCGKRWPHG